MFVIAEFLGERDLIEAIPKVWLFNDTHTYWPPRKQSKDSSNLIKRQIGPGSTWPIYAICIMGTAGMYVLNFSLQLVQISFNIVQLNNDFVTSHSFID